ncbi:hypothetical protein [Pseudomonas syringae]|uniref:hypothetical protein n=1 Tax=Pseudomonas syringae TaxID=317 RepID=UPI000AB0AAB6|nr:hypothetical protein [Pseudomonas syringae]
MDETPPTNNTDKNKQQETPSANVDKPQAQPTFGDISDSLKAPFLPHVKPDAISYEEVHTGVCVHIPGSAKMLFGDELVFYWGVNSSSTPILLKHVNSNSVVRVLCISYHFIECVQYGLVDLYFEVYRDQQLIGTSPALVVTVNRNSPVTPRQRQRKRNMIRRYAKKPDKNRF